MGKIRRVDFYPDEFWSGVSGMSFEEIGYYWLVCTKIYSHGGALPDDDIENARVFRTQPRTWRRLKRALIARGKLKIVDNTIINKRCMDELSKSKKRIDEARAAGKQGGRPPGGTGLESPLNSDSTGIHRESLAETLGIDGHKSPHELNGNNDITKATGFSGEKLTSNQQPTTNKAEEASPPPKENSYAFTGKVIRLTAVDFQNWQDEFRETIPDLMVQLADDDAYYDRTLEGKERTQWFHRLHRKLVKHHQRVLGERARDRRPDLTESF